MHKMQRIPQLPIWQACTCGTSAVSNKSMASIARRLIFCNVVHASCFSNTANVCLHSRLCGWSSARICSLCILVPFQAHQIKCSTMEMDQDIHLSACDSHTHRHQHTSYKQFPHCQSGKHASKPQSGNAAFLAAQGYAFVQLICTPSASQKCVCFTAQPSVRMHLAPDMLFIACTSHCNHEVGV